MTRVLLALVMGFSISAFAAEPSGPTPDQQIKEAKEKTDTGAVKIETEHGIHPGATEEGDHAHNKKMEKRRKKKAKKAQDSTP